MWRDLLATLRHLTMAQWVIPSAGCYVPSALFKWHSPLLLGSKSTISVCVVSLVQALLPCCIIFQDHCLQRVPVSGSQLRRRRFASVFSMRAFTSPQNVSLITGSKPMRPLCPVPPSPSKSHLSSKCESSFPPNVISEQSDNLSSSRRRMTLQVVFYHC